MHRLNILRQQGLVNSFKSKNIVSILVNNYSDTLNELKPDQLLTIISTLAELDYHDKEFENKVGDVIDKKLMDFNLFELEKFILPLKKLGFLNESFVNKFIDVTSESPLSEFNDARLISLLSSFAELDSYISSDNYTLIEDLLKGLASRKLDKLPDTQLGNLMYSFSILYSRVKFYSSDPDSDSDSEDDDLKEVEKMLVDFTFCILESFRTPELLTKVIIALAELEHIDEEYMDRWTNVVAGRLNEFTNAELVESMNALRGLYYCNESFEDKWANVIIQRINALSIEESKKFIDTVPDWYHGKDFWMNFYVHMLSLNDFNDIKALLGKISYIKPNNEKFINVIINKLTSFNTKELANAISTLAYVNHKDIRFQMAWIETATERLNEFTNKQLISSLSACSELGYISPLFQKAWIDEITSRNKLTRQESIGIINAFAKLGHLIAVPINSRKLDEYHDEELESVVRAFAGDVPFNKLLTRPILDLNEDIEPDTLSAEPIQKSDTKMNDNQSGNPSNPSSSHKRHADSFVSREDKRRRVSISNVDEHTSQESNLVQRVLESRSSPQPGPSWSK